MRVIFWLVLLCYGLVMAYFAFWPFMPIPGLTYPDAVPEAPGVTRAGLAYEVTQGERILGKRLAKTGRMSLEVLLQTDSLRQEGPARIISFSRDTMNRNFTLGQEGHELVFRLHTSETDHNGQYRSLWVPLVFNHTGWQHLVVTFDGAQVKLYVDGKLHPRTVGLGGDFSCWGRNQILVVGDEVPGGRPWRGTIQRFSIYDRALGADEVAMLYENKSVPEPVLAPALDTLARLRYRNLFVSTDPAAYILKDCLANIIGFIPLAGLVWLVSSAGLKRRKLLSVWVLPAALGLTASMTIELAQRHIVGRVPCTLDLVYNLLGTLLGCLLLGWVLVCTRKITDFK